MENDECRYKKQLNEARSFTSSPVDLGQRIGFTPHDLPLNHGWSLTLRNLFFTLSFPIPKTEPYSEGTLKKTSSVLAHESQRFWPTRKLLTSARSLVQTRCSVLFSKQRSPVSLESHRARR